MVFNGATELFILIFFVQTSSTKKECYRFNPGGGFDSFCCDNHVRINNVCVECKPGTSSRNEKPCKPCNSGRYGIKCGYVCNCKINERCESVSGCQLIEDLFTTIIRQFTLMSTVEYMDEVSATNNNQQQSSESEHKHISSKAIMKQPVSNVQTSPMLEQSSVTIRENSDVKEGLSSREVLVYSLGTAAFGITCTFMCIAFIWFHRGKTRQLIDNSTIHSENQVSEDSNSCYSLYEMIDEGAIYDDNVLDDNSEYSENKYCKTESEDSTLNSEKSGYLLPFTSIIPNHGKEEHPYSRNLRSSRGSTESSFSNHIEKDLKHINSYEQLQTDELNEQSQSKYTQLPGVHYLELLDIRKEQTKSDYFIIDFFKNCCDSPVSNIKHNSRHFRKCFSNNDISGEEICGACKSSKNKSKIRRCYSE